MLSVPLEQPQSQAQGVPVMLGKYFHSELQKYFTPISSTSVQQTVLSTFLGTSLKYMEEIPMGLMVHDLSNSYSKDSDLTVSNENNGTVDKN